MMSEFRLMSKYPVQVGEFNVHPVILEDILKLGEETYNQYLGLISISKAQLTQYTTDKDIKKLSVYKLVLLWCLEYESFHQSIVDCLSFFLKEVIVIDKDGIAIKRNDRLLYMNEDIYSTIVSVVKTQNFISNDEVSSYKPATTKAKQLLEKMQKAKERAKKEKAEESVTLSDVISIVACYSNDINILNVWDLTVYQLYTVYLRLLIWDDYQTKQNMIPHVTDVKALDIKHWSMSINKKLNKK